MYNNEGIANRITCTMRATGPMLLDNIEVHFSMTTKKSDLA